MKNKDLIEHFQRRWQVLSVPTVLAVPAAAAALHVAPIAKPYLTPGVAKVAAAVWVMKKRLHHALAREENAYL